MICPHCNREIQADSAFCRFCGKEIHPPASGEEQALLARTNPFVSSDAFFDSQKAIEEYLDKYPDRPSALHVRLTYFARRSMLLTVLIKTDQFDQIQWGNTEPIAHEIYGQLPAVLDNGIRTNLRVADGEARDDATQWMANLVATDGGYLESLFELEKKEADSLLIDGKTRAIVEQVTVEAAYDQAEVHYAEYQKKNYDAALAGFLELVSLQPSDAYFRNIVGSIYSMTGRSVPALRQFLYGCHLDPLNTHLTENLVRELCGLGFFPAAFEVGRHFQMHSDEADSDKIRVHTNMAGVCIAMQVGTQLPPEAFSETSPDLLDEYQPSMRPWLQRAAPSQAKEGGTSPLVDAKVFISYRRSEALDWAKRIKAHMEKAVPGMRVFRDESDIDPGVRWEDHLRAEVDAADIVLVLIDENWFSDRLKQAGDMVRREVARALAPSRSNIVFPVLLDAATMPAASHLPNEMRDLAAIQAHTLSDARFSQTVERLLDAMARAHRARKEERRRTTEELEEFERSLQEGGSLEDQPGFEAAIEKGLAESVQTYVPDTPQGEEGIRNCVLDGVWEVTGTRSDSTWKLRFYIGWARPFEGHFELLTPQNQLVEEHEISGNWYPVYFMEEDPPRLLGIQLDGLQDEASPFRLRLPIHRKVGNHFVGESNGIHWVSQNVDPRKSGF